MTSVNDIFEFNSDYTFSGVWNPGNGGNNGWTDRGTSRHHTNPTAVAERLAVVKELAQIKDSNGRPIYDHWDFHSNGLRIPVDTQLAEDLGRSSNLTSHTGYREALAGPQWFGSLSEQWATVKSDIDAKLRSGEITPKTARSEIRTAATNITSEIRGTQAWLQSRTMTQIDGNGERKVKVA